jgi:hypothetical protein
MHVRQFNNGGTYSFKPPEDDHFDQTCDGMYHCINTLYLLIACCVDGHVSAPGMWMLCRSWSWEVPGCIIGLYNLMCEGPKGWGFEAGERCCLNVPTEVQTGRGGGYLNEEFWIGELVRKSVKYEKKSGNCHSSNLFQSLKKSWIRQMQT